VLLLPLLVPGLTYTFEVRSPLQHSRSAGAWFVAPLI
jgi:hypothetical protein